MTDTGEGKREIRLECPCCKSVLQVDAVRGVVLSATEAASAVRKAASLSEANRVVAEESSRIDEKYQQIVAAEKGRGAAMDKLFKSFMEKAKDDPEEKPVRDIDLD